ncbi:MAG: hypothetical protein Q9183_005891, partial [Haloplaca sp. 2 TL-2023]
MPRKQEPKNKQARASKQSTGDARGYSEKKRSIEQARFEIAVAQQRHETTGYNTGIDWLRPPKKKSASFGEDHNANLGALQSTAASKAAERLNEQSAGSDSDDEMEDVPLSFKAQTGARKALQDSRAQKETCEETISDDDMEDYDVTQLSANLTEALLATPAPKTRRQAPQRSLLGMAGSDTEEDDNFIAALTSPSFKPRPKAPERSLPNLTTDARQDEHQPLALASPSFKPRPKAPERSLPNLAKDNTQDDHKPIGPTNPSSKPRQTASQRSLLRPAENKKGKHKAT